MQYMFVEEKPTRSGGVTVVLSVPYAEVEKATEQEVDNFVGGMKIMLGAVLPSQTTGGNELLFNFMGCTTPQNLKK